MNATILGAARACIYWPEGRFDALKTAPGDFFGGF
jgi:hypothetical protein